MGEGQPHPRCYGTYPRILGHCVRDKHVLSLEDAVRKASFVPADRLGLAEKSRVRLDADADLVIFDAATIDARLRPCCATWAVVSIWRHMRRSRPTSCSR